MNRCGFAAAYLIVGLLTACSDGVDVSTALLADAARIPAGSASIIAVGDVATCDNDFDEATAKIADTLSGTIALLGDNAYVDGSREEFRRCYEPTWGRHKSRTRPSLGNHEYGTPGAAGYFEYYGAAGGDPDKGYYSYDLGAWHIIALNSNIARSAGSPQIEWLKSDLAANAAKKCTLAYWHHPRFSSANNHGNDSTQAEFWNVLYAANADVVLNGHDHDYERFAPQSPDARADSAKGIRQFVVGTGGASHYGVGARKPNSEVFNGEAFGLLRMILSPDSYSWDFVPATGDVFRDSGSGKCI